MKQLTAGRYVILLMGIFSMFTCFFYNALLYNFISLMMPYWSNKILTLDPASETNPSYRRASYWLSILPGIYFKVFRYLIPLQFLPRIIFLVFLSLWLSLSVLMVMKWFMYGPKRADFKSSSRCATLILIFLIDMLLLSTTKPVDEGCDAYIFPNRPLVQNILLSISLLCVPIILFGPPLYLSRVYKKKSEEEALVRFYTNK